MQLWILQAGVLRRYVTECVFLGMQSIPRTWRMVKVIKGQQNIHMTYIWSLCLLNIIFNATTLQSIHVIWGAAGLLTFNFLVLMKYSCIEIRIHSSNKCKQHQDLTSVCQDTRIRPLNVEFKASTVLKQCAFLL